MKVCYLRGMKLRRDFLPIPRSSACHSRGLHPRVVVALRRGRHHRVGELLGSVKDQEGIPDESHSGRRITDAQIPLTADFADSV